MTAEQPPQESMSLPIMMLARPPEWVRFRRFAGVLLAIIHLLHKLLGFLLVHERQTGQTFFGLKSMKERSILVIGPSIVYLLIPYYAPSSRLSIISYLLLLMEPFPNIPKHLPTSTSKCCLQDHWQALLLPEVPYTSICVDQDMLHKAALQRQPVSCWRLWGHDV